MAVLGYQLADGGGVSGKGAIVVGRLDFEGDGLKHSLRYAACGKDSEVK